MGLLVILYLFASVSFAVEVRGRIDFRSYSGIFPMSRATVEFCQVGKGCTGYNTGYDGMYYLQTLPGPHDILVNGKFIIHIVIPNRNRFDIQPLVGNI